MVFVLDLARVLINVRVDVLQLVGSQLEFGLGLERHITNLSLVVFIFVVDILNFKGGVLSDLLDNLLVLLDNLQDLALLLIDLTLLNFDVLPVSLGLCSHLRNMVVAKLLQSSLVSSTLLILLGLQFLEASSILEHLLGVLITNLLDHFLLLVQLLSLLGSCAQNSFLERSFLSIQTVLVLKRIALDVLLESGNVVALLLNLKLLLHTLLVSLFQVDHLLLKGAEVALIFLHLGVFGQDLVRELQVRIGFLRSTIAFAHIEEAQHAVLSN